MHASELLAKAKHQMKKINSISRESGKIRVYPYDFKNDLAILLKIYGRIELSKSLKIPDNLLYSIIKMTEKEGFSIPQNIKSTKQNKQVISSELNFIELPASLLNVPPTPTEEQKISISVPNTKQPKLVMKFVTNSGTTIEIFE